MVWVYDLMVLPEVGYDVGRSGSRPHGTTQEAGYDLGRKAMW